MTVGFIWGKGILREVGDGSGGGATSVWVNAPEWKDVSVEDVISVWDGCGGGDVSWVTSSPDVALLYGFQPE